MIPKKDKSNTGNEELLSVSEYFGVVPRKVIREDEDHLTRSDSLEGYLKVAQGDLVNNIMLMWKKGLGVSKYNGIVSPAYSVFRFVSSIPKYYHYLLRTNLYITEFRKNSRGIIQSRLRLYDDDFGEIYSHLPPLSEQKRIAFFLDTKTRKIDELIKKTKQKVDLLKENRVALINHCVTKGVNANAEMKASGIEWIGKIPCGWKQKPLKFSFKITKGKTPKKVFDEPNETSLPYLSMNVLRGGNVQGYCDKLDGIIVKNGDILILWDGSKSGEILLGINGILSSTMSKLSLFDDNLNQNFCFYLLKCYENDFQNNTIGMGIPHVNGNHLICTKLIIPPLQEQKQIVLSLNIEIHKFEAIIKKEIRRIELLKEYRQSLISEVVTGKIDMRDWKG